MSKHAISNEKESVGAIIKEIYACHRDQSSAVQVDSAL